jgi:Lrp/AsnC family transcriptional regulator, leucine-responsive regulatory protein
MEKKLDDVNLKILNILQTDARMPVKQIASEVCLSAPAVSARIARMEHDKLISGYQLKLDYHQFGYFIKAFINLAVEPKQKPEFYPYIKSVANVIECNCVTGDYSMLIEVVFRKTEELDHFVNELQRFGKTLTQIVFSTSVEHRNIPVQL